MSNRIIIGVEFDFDNDEFVLNATNYSRSAPAGPRLFRANPPDVKFRHASKESADRDCGVLQRYLDGLAPTKRKPTKKERAEGA